MIQNIPLTPMWYQIPLPELPDSSVAREPLAQFRIAALTSRANSLLSEIRSGAPQQSSSSNNSRKPPKINNAPRTTADQAFLKQILSDGTHQDKLSALILLVRESPLHRISELERLRVMAGGSSTEAGGVKGGGGGREERVSAVRGLADWWVSGGGKDVGKLRWELFVIVASRVGTETNSRTGTSRINLCYHTQLLRTDIFCCSLSKIG